MIPARLKRKGVTAGAVCVALSSVAILAAAVLVMCCWWDILIGDDSPTSVFRNMGLLAAGLVALVFAFWRGTIAEEQAATARLDHLHGRFERALELFAREGDRQSATRISGMHAFRYLVRDEPGEFAVETIEIVTTFMVQAELERDLKEFGVAHITATRVCDVVDERRLFDEPARRRLRANVDQAADLLANRLHSAGKDPGQIGL